MAALMVESYDVAVSVFSSIVQWVGTLNTDRLNPQALNATFRKDRLNT